MVPIVLVAEGGGPRSSPLPKVLGPASQLGGALVLRRAQHAFLDLDALRLLFFR